MYLPRCLEEEEIYRSLSRFRKLADREKAKTAEDEIAERVNSRKVEEGMQGARNEGKISRREWMKERRVRGSKN